MILHKGIKIFQAVKSVWRKNKISGHEYQEHTKINKWYFDVTEYGSVQACKDRIDFDIKFGFLNEKLKC